jgi:LmbE family N-acetylglucosaminyl deacetylase
MISQELSELAGELRLPDWRRSAQARWLVVAAHPDDETIGASWILRRAKSVQILQITDGAPRDRSLWPRNAPQMRQRYAVLRAVEEDRAMMLAGLSPRVIHRLGFVDQEATDHLVDLTLSLEQLLQELRPWVVVVQPYEGGHPDHDASAFAVHTAIRRRKASGQIHPALVEMSSYHRWNGRLRTGRFLPAPKAESSRRLSPNERGEKSRMLACFASQAEVLSAFKTDQERFRPAPRYDFCSPPHQGPLHYETLGWPRTGWQWRELAAHALEVLGLAHRTPVEQLERRRPHQR